MRRHADEVHAGLMPLKSIAIIAVIAGAVLLAGAAFVSCRWVIHDFGASPIDLAVFATCG